MTRAYVAAACALVIGLGMIGLALWGTGWSAMLAFMILWSSGVHLMMPITSSVGMHLADPARKGRRLGQVYGAGIAATLLGCGFVWVGMKYLDASYRVTFLVGGLAAICAAKKKGKGGGFREIDVSLRANGTFEQFLRFLNSLERHESFVRVNSFTCTPPGRAEVDDEGQETWPLRIALNISTFRYDSGK